MWNLRTPAQFQEGEMSPGLLQDFMVSVSSVTQGNEDMGLVQDYIFVPGVTQGNEDTGSTKISPCCFFVVNRDN